MRQTKRILAGLLAAASLFIFSGCNGASGSSTAQAAKNPAAADVVAAVADALELPGGMVMLEESKLFDLYALDREKTEDAAAFIDASRATACEVTVFKVKDAADIGMAEQAAQTRIEDQTFSYENYNPAEMVKIKDAQVYTKGNYVILVMADDTTKAKEVFEAQL